MNLITIMSDSFRYDHVGVNGNDWIRTPSLDRFAREHAMVFENAYCGSFPTIPNRTDIHTGYWTSLRRGWTPLQADDLTLARHLSANGFRTMHVWDTPHLGNSDFRKGFDGWKWIRGQEGDGFEVKSSDTIPFDREKCREDLAELHLTNHTHRQFEKDYAAPNTFATAERWLEHNYDKGDFYLAVDTFDPHEPWDPPEYYANLYDRDYDGHTPIYIPKYQYCDGWTEAQVRHTRAMYAGECTMVDHAVGRLLQKVEDMGLLGSTLVVFMSDHGHLLGDHGRFGKSNRDAKMFPDDPRYQEERVWPLYRDIARINMMIHLPGTDASRTGAIMQPVDLFPTFCEFLGVDKPDTLEGRSLIPVLRGATDTHRDIAVTTSYIKAHDMAITDGSKTHYILGDTQAPLLFDLETDPREEHDILDGNEEEGARLRSLVHQEFAPLVEDKALLDVLT